jgi:hypothetical protein
MTYVVFSGPRELEGQRRDQSVKKNLHPKRYRPSYRSAAETCQWAYSLVQRESKPNACAFTAEEGQHVAPYSWHALDCIRHTVASLFRQPSFRFPFFRIRAPELDQAVDRRDRYVDSITFVDRNALPQHTVPVDERPSKRYDIILDSRTMDTRGRRMHTHGLPDDSIEQGKPVKSVEFGDIKRLRALR